MSDMTKSIQQDMKRSCKMRNKDEIKVLKCIRGLSNKVKECMWDSHSWYWISK